MDERSAERSGAGGIADGFGGKYSAVLVGPDARKYPPPPAGKIVAALLKHDLTDVRHRNVASEHELRLGFVAQAGNIGKAEILWSDDGRTWQTQDMYSMGQHFGLEDFAGLIWAQHGPVSYVFRLTDGPTVAYLAGGELYSSAEEAEGRAYRCDMEPAFSTPEWAKHAVWYQIFPERFRNGGSVERSARPTKESGRANGSASWMGRMGIFITMMFGGGGMGGIFRGFWRSCRTCGVWGSTAFI